MAERSSTRIVPFDTLTPSEIYDILALRQQVFMIEQSCDVIDADGLDKQCQHAVIYDSYRLAAYARIIPPELAYVTAGIGRFVVAENYRGKYFGKQLLSACIDYCNYHYKKGITLSAQIQAAPFYEKAGFDVISDVYDEAGIPHVKMQYKV